MEKQMCEQATGCRERQDGMRFYDGDGNAVSDTAARRIVREGEPVEVPGAGAGSYRGIAWRLGYTRLEVEDWTSSAGDWCFRLHGGKYMWQENMWPSHGFRYRVGRPDGGV